MFNNNDVICFLGDSLTASGLWEAEVFQHIRHRANIKCYNCGVSGSTAALASEYLYSFCLEKNPTHVVIMFGVNDIDRSKYSIAYTENDKEKCISEAIKVHAEKMEYITKACLDFGSKVILCTPVPYDEFNEGATENLRCQRGLDKCAEAVLAIAAKYSLPVVDFRKRMLPLIKELKPISADRVHPTQFGYHVMGQIFLSEICETDKVDFETAFVHEKWNSERQSIEKTIKLIDFIDYVLLFKISKENDWTVTEKIEECKIRYEKLENKLDYFGICYAAYLKYAKKREELIGELVKRTARPY